MFRPGSQIGTAALVAALAAAGALTGLAGAVRADVFHLANGGQVEGEEVSRQGTLITIRTRHGEKTLPAEQVVRVEKGPLSWQVYERLRKDCPETPDGHYRLGLWCRERMLDDLARKEFAGALELDPNHGPTRQALGHVRVGGVWLELGGPATRPDAAASGPATVPPAGPADGRQALEAARLALHDADRAMVQLLRAEWFKRIRAIRTTYLDSPNRKRFAQGADLLLAIRDPLAVESMLQVLSGGPAEQRKLLAEALGRFQTSAATMGLLEAAILDEDVEVRRAALTQLAGRSDVRILPYLLKALSSDEENVVRNAARGLGHLRPVEAVPALVKVLTDKDTRVVRTEAMVETMRRHFVDETGQLRSVTFDRRRSNPWAPPYRTVTVTVFRTEVQEALIAITGENYGFDAEGWMEWYRRRSSSPREQPDRNPPPLPPPPAGK